MGRMQEAPPMTTSKQSPAPSILRQIEDFARKYVVLTDDQFAVLAAWIVHTHTFGPEQNVAYATPYPYVHSPEPESGKTRVIEVAEVLVRNPARTINISPAGLYKQIESEQPTLLIDEVDAIYAGNKNEDLRGVLNGGYKVGGYVTRNDPRGDGVLRYSTFCPKMFAGIDNSMLPDTLLSRSIPFKMQRATREERDQLSRFIGRKIAPEADALKAKIEAWVTDQIETLIDAEPKIEDAMGDRQWEISEPLIAIAERAGRGEGKRIRNALLNLFRGEGPAKTEQTRVLEAIRDWFTDHPDRTRVFSSELIEAVNERTRANYHAKGFGVILARYNVSPKNVRIGSNQAKGFDRHQFEDVFSRYL